MSDGNHIANLDSLRARALFMWLILLPLAIVVFIAAIALRPGQTASSDVMLPSDSTGMPGSAERSDSK